MASNKKLGTLEVELKAKVDSFKKSINDAKKKINDVGDKANKLKSAMGKGMKFTFSTNAQKMTAEFVTLQNKIDESYGYLRKLEQAKKALSADKPSLVADPSGYEAWLSKMSLLQSEINKTKDALKGMQDKATIMQSIGSATERVRGPFARLRASISDTVAMSPKLRNIPTSLAGIKSKCAQAASGFRKVAGYIGSMLSKAKNAIPILRNLGNSGKSSGNLVGAGFKKILMYGFGIRSIFKLVNRLRQTMIDGFSDIASGIPTSEFASQLNSIKASFYGLKGAFVSAFAPIFTYVAPALSYLISILSSALSAIGQFFSAITGKEYVTASVSMGSVGASADSAAGSADKATKANEKLKRTLMGFDKINKLDSSDESDSGSSGGGGGGGGGGSSSPITYSEGNVSKSVQEFAKKVKEAWKKGDFTGIGDIVGQKIKKELDNIPWDKIQATSGKGGKSIATFLNGLFQSEGLTSSVGNAFAQALNTIIEFGYQFVTNFEWRKFGVSIGNGVNTFIKNVEWTKLAATFGEGLKGIIDSASGFLETVDWQQIGKTFYNMLAAIDWGGLFISAFRLAGNIAGAIAGVIQGALSGLWGTVKNYFKKKFKECGGNIPLGLLKGIKDALVNIPTWIKDHIFKPFLDGVKSAFGIASPSKEMKPIGKDIISGLLGGLKDKFKSVLTWAKGLADKFKEKLGDAKEWVTEKAKTVKTKLVHVGGKIAEKLGFKSDSEARSTLSGKTKEIKTKITNSGSKVYTAVGTTKKQFSDIMASRMKTLKLKIKSVGKSLEAIVGSKKVLTVKVKRKVSDGGGNIEKFLGINKALAAKIKRTHASGWTTIAKFLDINDVKSAKIKRAHAAGWTSIGEFLGIAKNLTAYIKKAHASGDASISSFLGIDKVKTATIDLKLTWRGKTVKSANSKLWTTLGITFAKEGGFFKGGRWSPVTQYASGGYPNSGQLFVAREAGPELVGSMGGGTAVVNNDQIVASVSQGVANAVAGVITPLVRAVTNGSSGDLVVFLGDEEVARSAIRGMKKIDRVQHPVIQFEGF